MTENRLIDNHAPSLNILTETDETMFTDNSTLIAHDLVIQADACLAQTGIIEKLAQWRSDDRRTSVGRTPAIFDRAVLVALLLLARESSPLTMASLADLFQYRLATESEGLLDLDGRRPSPDGRVERERWYRFATSAFRRVVDPMDPFPQTPRNWLSYTEISETLAAHDPEREKVMKARLNEFTAAFLRMTFLQQPDRVRDERPSADLVIGQTFIPAAAGRGFSLRTLPDRVAEEAAGSVRPESVEPVDIFAGWYSRGDSPARGAASPAVVERKGGPHGHVDMAWGRMANVAVRVDSATPRAPRFPNLVVSATLSMPNLGVSEEAVVLMRAALDTGLTAGVVHANKQYFATATMDRLHIPTSELGFTPSTDYRVNRLGVSERHHSGAEFIEGAAYCPRMPEALKRASADFLAKFIDEETYRARLTERLRFQLRRRSTPDANGRFRMMCPPTAHEQADDSYPRARICTQGSVTFNKEDGLRQRQAFPYKSAKWEQFHRHASLTLEATVAAAFDPRCDGTTDRSQCARGFAAAQVMMTMLLTVHNLRTISEFMRNE